MLWFGLVCLVGFLLKCVTWMGIRPSSRQVIVVGTTKIPTNTPIGIVWVTTTLFEL